MLESLFKTLEDFAFLFGILVGGAKTMQAKSEQEERQERQKRIRSMQRNIFLDIEPISGRDLFCYFYRKALGYLSKQSFCCKRISRYTVWSSCSTATILWQSARQITGWSCWKNIIVAAIFRSCRFHKRIWFFSYLFMIPFINLYENHHKSFIIMMVLWWK